MAARLEKRAGILPLRRTGRSANCFSPLDQAGRQPATRAAATPLTKDTPKGDVRAAKPGGESARKTTPNASTARATVPLERLHTAGRRATACGARGVSEGAALRSRPPHRSNRAAGDRRAARRQQRGRGSGADARLGAASRGAHARQQPRRHWPTASEEPVGHAQERSSSVEAAPRRPHTSLSAGSAPRLARSEPVAAAHVVACPYLPPLAASCCFSSVPPSDGAESPLPRSRTLR